MLKRQLLNRDFFGYNILDYTLFLSIVTLPLGHNINSLALISFCIAGALKNSWQDKRERLARSYIWILPVLLFFIFLTTLIWDPNGISALKSIEKKISFLVLPLIIASIPPFKRRTLKTALLLFVLSVLIVSLLCIIKSGAEYVETGDYRLFFYQYLSRQMGLNAIYLSLYCSFCLFILLHFYFIQGSGFKMVASKTALMLFIFFSVFLLLLSSKMLIIITFFLIVCSIIFLSYKRSQFIKGTIITLLILICAGFIVANAPYIKWRAQVTSFKKYSGKEDDQNGLAVRQKLWETSIELIRQQPVIGYGIKHANERLVEEFTKDNFQIAAVNRYNSHNTYFQALLNAGIIALIPLLILFLGSIVLAIKSRNYLFLIFGLTILLLGNTEALFEGQKGTVFILLFLFLFIYHFSYHLREK